MRLPVSQARTAKQYFWQGMDRCCAVRMVDKAGRRLQSAAMIREDSIIPSVIFVIVGGFLTKVLDSQYLELFLGIFLIFLALLFIIKEDLIINPNRRNAIVGGSLSGFSAGLLGTGGAIRGLTMAAFNLEKSIFIATSAFIDFLIDFSRMFVYYYNGFIHKHDLIYVPFLLVIGIVGTAFGKKVLSFIPQDKFKRISLVLILIIGLITLINALVT